MIKQIAIIISVAVITTMAQEAPVGSVSEMDKNEKSTLEKFKSSLNGKIVWSSSRSNSRHDLWIMNADGTEQRQLTKGDNVDWYSRFSPDGLSIVFTRSKSGWVPEADAEMNDKWDIWTVNSDGTDEKMVAENACWATWRPSGDSIVFARGSKVIIKSLIDNNEKELFDSELKIKKGTYSQQPQISKDGLLMAVTLRGTKRETIIWNFQKDVMYSTGGGCESDWFPNSRKIVRVNEGQGNGGTEILAIELDNDGKPSVNLGKMGLPKSIRFMDLPGRRSHEYFPKIDNTGNWMIWCATQYGHEHDIADYEVYVWNISNKENENVRLTFHTGNDRWPDIWINQ